MTIREYLDAKRDPNFKGKLKLTYPKKDYIKEGKRVHDRNVKLQIQEGQW